MSAASDLELAVVPDRSHIMVHTSAEGLLSRIAHDLALKVESPRGRARVPAGALTASPDGGDLEPPRGATLELDVTWHDVRVVGVRKRSGEVDEGALSGGDRADIEQRVEVDVFRGATLEVRALSRGREIDIDLTLGQGRSRVTGEARLSRTAVTGPNEWRVRGQAKLSLKSLGVKELRGPLGAFRVADEVAVYADLVLVSADA